MMVSAVVGSVVFLLWDFGVLDVVWMRNGVGILLAISLAVNAVLIMWLVFHSKATADKSKRLIDQQTAHIGHVCLPHAEMMIRRYCRVRTNAMGLTELRW